MYDTYARTLTKAVIFRIQTIALHWVITYLFTKSAEQSTTMVFTITTINMVFYWFLERYFATYFDYGWVGTDLKRRSLVKAVVYKTWSLAVSLIVGYLVLGSLMSASLLTLYKQLIALGDFYIYERVWNRIKWGRRQEQTA
jgi:uncharacterized membrane protein